MFWRLSLFPSPEYLSLFAVLMGKFMIYTDLKYCHGIKVTDIIMSCSSDTANKKCIQDFDKEPFKE
jgi:hypothetical protein